MSLHDLKFLIRQPALLVQDGIRYPDLSDIMQMRRNMDLPYILLFQLNQFTYLQRHFTDSL